MAHGEARVTERRTCVRARDGTLIPADRLLGRTLITVLRQTLWRTPLRVRRRLLRFAPLRAVHDAIYRRFGVHVVPERRLGFSMEIDVSQFDFRAHFRTPHVEHHVVDFLAANVGPGARALDVGSFCGYYALLFARRAGPSGRVVAFEPVGEHASWVERNVELNGFDNVRVDRRAVGGRTGTAQLRVRGPQTSLVGGGRGHDEAVEVVSLDDFLSEGGIDRIDVVKLDVEHAELEALDGMRHVLAQYGPLVVVEVNDAAGQAAVERFFRSAGYSTDVLGRAAHGVHLVGRPRPPD